MAALHLAIFYFNRFCIAFTLLLSGIYLFQFIVSYVQMRKTIRREPADDFSRYSDSDNLMPVSIIIPAYNEQENIVCAVRSLLKLRYPAYEIIVVNDGSTDGTGKAVLEAFGLTPVGLPVRVSLPTGRIRGVYASRDFPDLLYVEKDNGGKADALNAGINVSKYPLYVCLDADSQLEKDAILRLAAEFIKDTTTIVAGGLIRISNGSVIEDGEWKSFRMPDSRVECFQIVEYLRAFLSGRISWSPANALLIVSGAFGVFNKQAVIAAGGYRTGMAGEDMEIILRLRRYMKEIGKPYAIRFSEDAVCWTQGPLSLRDLRVQRRRWQTGLIGSLLRHGSMFLNPRYGAAGMLAVPYAWIFEFLGAGIEALGYVIIPLAYFTGDLSLTFFLLYLAVATGLGITISLGGLILEQTGSRRFLSAVQILALVKYAILENLGYRQLITLFRAEGILRYRRFRNSWGRIRRAEFNTPEGNFRGK